MEMVPLESQTSCWPLFTQDTHLGQTKFLPKKEIPGDTFGKSYKDKGVQEQVEYLYLELLLESKQPRKNIAPGSIHPTRYHPMCSRMLHLKEQLTVKLRQCRRTKGKLVPPGLQDLTTHWGHNRGPGALYSSGNQCEQAQPGGALEPLSPAKKTEDPGRLKATENHRQGEAAEAGLGNKVKHFPHWINPEMKGQGHKESILLSKDETVPKTMTKKVEKTPSPTKHPVTGAKLEKKTEEEGMTFFDAPQSLDSELKQQSLLPRRSWFLCLSHDSSKHCPQLTCATQPENPSHQKALVYTKEYPVQEKGVRRFPILCMPMKKEVILSVNVQ
ncbi:hypothetical protein GH733_011446, partial [Mirounga leonina]